MYYFRFSKIGSIVWHLRVFVFGLFTNYPSALKFPSFQLEYSFCETEVIIFAGDSHNLLQAIKFFSLLMITEVGQICILEKLDYHLLSLDRVPIILYLVSLSF